MAKTAQAPAEFPTFSHWLATRDDAQLTTIITNRPDSTKPLPPGFAALAARLELPGSILRAAIHLPAPAIAVVHLATRHGGDIKPVDTPTIIKDAAEFLSEKDTLAAIRTLFDYAFAYGTPQRFQLTPHLFEYVKNITALPEAGLTYDEFHHALRTLNPVQRRILDTLAQSGPIGTTKDADPDADPTKPIPTLIAQGLLHRVTNTTVKLPDRLKWALTGQEPPLIPLTLPQPTPITPKQQQAADNHSTATALEVVRHVRTLLEHLGDAPLELLSDGTIGVRALRKLSKTLDLSEKDALRTINVARGTELVATETRWDRDTTQGELILAPTHDVDEFLNRPLHQQWAILVQGWWDNGTLMPWKVEKPTKALSPDSISTELLQLRSTLLDYFTGAATITNIRAILGYHQPLIAHRIAPTTITEIITEAHWLGLLVTATDAPEQFIPTTLLQALTSGETFSALAQITQPLTPAPISYLIPQGDMTLLAPGPLEYEIQQDLTLLADVESPGLASTYRISEASIRRAFDAGRSAQDITAFFTNHLQGDLPQTVEFIIQDIARNHGQLRSGAAQSYLRCDDEALMLQLSRSPIAQKTGLHLIAPTVAISPTPLRQILELIKEYGFHAIAEDIDGTSIDIRPQPARIGRKPDQPYEERLNTPTPPTDLTPEHISAVLAALHTEPTANASDSTSKSSTFPALIRAAIRENHPLTIKYVDSHNELLLRVLTPISLESNMVSTIDEKTGTLIRIPLHRIHAITND
ncbi:MAG: helicase-associated domain-containing protein [Corynebacterium sp.]|nr:helicase-associated domain-containing protein [Corynebacterium sp.]